MTSVADLADVERLRFRDELSDARLARLDDAQREVVARVADDLDRELGLAP